MLNESEREGIGRLKSLSGLVKGDLLTLNINNEITSGQDIPKKVELKVNMNITVMELRLKIA